MLSIDLSKLIEPSILNLSSQCRSFTPLHHADRTRRPVHHRMRRLIIESWLEYKIFSYLAAFYMVDRNKMYSVLQQFDVFSLKYSPCGVQPSVNVSLPRKIFLVVTLYSSPYWYNPHVCSHLCLISMERFVWVH